MLRFDGEVDAAPLGVACDFVVPLVVEPVCVPLWAKALLAVKGNNSRTPLSTALRTSVGRNFIRTLFPAWRSAPRALAMRTSSLSRGQPSSARSGSQATP